MNKFETLEDFLKYDNERKIKHKISMKRYRNREDKKGLLKDISKKCYDKTKENEEKYKLMLEKKKIYYQENKEKIREKNLLKKILKDT